ncbi:putative bifunctional diguanylate cyclase/phosphodiesterase [Merismopedia glauca]|uniref:GGDEF-domain containing protein n=1 Tax=Merismopedia glauca CCAP 1448/3 TaxID=1296344 RepID=A0A2T1C1C7_9CYAN|nr:GGDEF domain-containing phosphodiesterase [Merismopedia glauca]PSB02085.1 GGDEF-domain containing protein [Merismopedia glauca CCAP 1448/3]
MHSDRQLWLYSSLARLKFLKNSYPAKIMLVAFLGTHVPLLTLVLSFLISSSSSWEMTVRVLGITLLATLGGTAATLYALHHLLAPIIVTSAGLQKYLDAEILPELPREFTDEVGTLMGDTCQTLHQLDELIHQIKNYDNLTGLPNRQLFCDRLHQILLQPHGDERLIAVFSVGIDDYIAINHSLEPEKSNLLLRAVAHRLKTCLNTVDICAYLGNGELAIARLEINSFESMIELSQLISSALAKPFSVEGNLIYLTASIGITINHLGDPGGAAQLLQQAHIALYQAKLQGRGQCKFYSPEINAQLQERLALENELHGALDRGEMVVFYQPLIDLDSGKLTALEALVRWQHPTRGLVSPAKFIPIAEANGMIINLGEWVLQTACAQNRAWQLAGFPPIRISVNLSARQFEQPDLVQVVERILQETELEPSYLELEVTESFLMNDIDNSVKILKELRNIGLWVALDDFGTGYSSLNYLKRFPLDMLKIDRSFVNDVTSNSDSAAVTDAIIALAKSLRLNITAEGVETKEQLDYLQNRGCNEGQGFYFCRPVPADTISNMLEKDARLLEV